MFTGLDDIAWSSLHHAYGTAEEVPGLLRAMASPDAEVREKALSAFSSAVHHQGDVTSCTTAAVPFLLELACSPEVPDRAAIVGLLVSIGRNAVEHYDDLYVDYVGEESNHALAADLIRGRASEFVAFAADGDHRLRHAAIPALAQFIDDAPRAVELLRNLFRGEERTMERLLLVETMARLAMRLPATLAEAVTWFDILADDAAVEPETRLAALAQRTRCVPEQISPDLIPAAVDLLRQVALKPLPPDQWASPTRTRRPMTGAPPQVADAFRQLDHQNTVFAPTTSLLRTLHTALGTRVAERTTLLTAQLESPDPGSRLDALRMAEDLMANCRGDHNTLITLVAMRLEDSHAEVSAQAAQVLSDCHAVAEPARHRLAAHLLAQCTGHGPGLWAAPDAPLRRAHQNAVLALARLGDERAVPYLVAALVGEVDGWRAVQVAGCLPQASAELTPPLCRLLAATDLATEQPFDMGTRALLTALGSLADPAAAPTVCATLDVAAELERWQIVVATLLTLAALGESAVAALPRIRSLIRCPDGLVRSAAAKALCALGAEPAELMPLVLEALSGTANARIADAVEILATMDPETAAPAVPRLRELLRDSYEWTRIYAAAGLWQIIGEAEAEAVLDTLLEAWSKNEATANFVLQILEKMGPAAVPAQPLLEAELARTRRGGCFSNIEDDEDLQRAVRRVIDQAD